MSCLYDFGTSRIHPPCPDGSLKSIGPAAEAQSGRLAVGLLYRYGRTRQFSSDLSHPLFRVMAIHEDLVVLDPSDLM